jgi:hypothetical protein
LNEFGTSGPGATIQQRFKVLPMRSGVDFDGDTLSNAAQQPERHRPGFPYLVQCPVLVTGFQEQVMKMSDSGTSNGFADGLVDPCATDLDLGKRPGCELAPLK